MSRAALSLLLALGAPALAAAAPPPAGGVEVARILDADRSANADPEAPPTERIDYAFDGMGLKGTLTSVFDRRDGRFVDSLSAGPANQSQGFDGARAWAKDPSGAVTPQDGGEQKILAVNEAYRRANLWWRADRGGAVIEALGVRKDASGADCDVLAVTPRGGKRFEAWFDAVSHRLSRVTEIQGAIPLVTTYGDYRPVQGVMIPWKTTIDDGEGAKYIQTLTVVSARLEGPAPTDAFSAPRVTLADFTIDGGAGRTVIPFRLINNHVYAEASVNGKGPFRFIFDTGGVNLVTPALARAIGLNTEGKFDAQGAGEGIMEAGLAKVAELKVGGARLSDQVFAIVPLDGLSDIEGVDEQGMVGFETFRRFVTRIDYGAGTITLIDPKAFDPADAGAPVPFNFADHDPEIAGSFEGVAGRFRIDTGSRSELTLNRPFAERNGVRAKHPRNIEAVDGWGIGGPSRAYVMRGASLKMGPVEVKDLVVSAATQAKGAFAGEDSEGNIGGGVLKRFVVTFDYAHQIMYLKPLTTSPPDAGTFDRAGLWFNRSPEGFKVVDVTVGGPAEAAGVKAGDVITAVDGHVAREMTVSDLRQRLRTAAPGTRITLTLLRGGRPLETAMTLRDLI